MNGSALSLHDDVAIVTGASSGIGAAVAHQLAAEGAAVALVGRDSSRLEAVRGDVEEAGGRATVVAVDLMQDGAAERIIAAANSSLGTVSVLIHSAGIYRRGSFAEAAIEDFDLMWQLHVRVPYVLTQAALEDLTPGGRVVFITSKAGRVGLPERAAYGASKAAAEMLASALAVELAGSRVRVNSVAPGFIASPMNATLRDDQRLVDYLESIIPAGRLGQVEEVARVATFLCTEAASYVHGQSLAVDGGYPTPPARPEGGS